VGLFDRFRRNRDTPTGPRASATTLAELEQFMTSRAGVEAFIEPPTSIYAMTLCLVADDGEHVRRAVKDEKQAKQLCAEQGVPIYDARIVGYPKRMKDFERGVKLARIDLSDLPPLEVAGEREQADDPED
jgi:1-acyl-sn-glycerol-3-phosphate acyltransferase